MKKPLILVIIIAAILIAAFGIFKYLGGYPVGFEDGRVLVKKYYCSDVCPAYGHWNTVYFGIENKEKCDTIGGKSIVDPAWRGFEGCAPQEDDDTKSQVYENQYIKVGIPSGWNFSEATRTIQDQSYDKNTGKTTLIGAPRVEKTGAVNVMKGSYILYINPQAGQASGIKGGRFNEISGGAPSADAVMTDPPSPPCGTSETFPAVTGHPRVDLHVGPQDKQAWCNVPSNGKTVWYFSYITDTNGSYFNYYKESEALSFVITMAYNSKDIDSFPVKGSATLNTILNEMTNIVKTLELKQK